MNFHYTKTLVKQGVSQAISAFGKAWEKEDVILYGFQGGTTLEKTSVEAVLEEVEGFTGLRFVPELTNPDITISFEKGVGSWSYIGTDAVHIKGPTMNFGWDITKDKATIRHEVGHMLGLFHEHQNPHDPIRFNEAVVIDTMLASGWTLDMIYHNILTVKEHEHIEYSTQRDPDSIMHYYYPVEWLIDPSQQGTRNTKFSATDKATLAAMYPPKEEEVDYKSLIQLIYADKRMVRLSKSTSVTICKKLGLDHVGYEKDLIERIQTFLND